MIELMVIMNSWNSQFVINSLNNILKHDSLWFRFMLENDTLLRIRELFVIMLPLLCAVLYFRWLGHELMIKNMA